MTDVIDRFLDHIGVTPGPWHGYYEVSLGLGTIDGKEGCKNIDVRIKDKPDARLIAQAREMLKALILMSINGCKGCMIHQSLCHECTDFGVARKIIESATCWQWSDITKWMEENANAD